MAFRGPDKTGMRQFEGTDYQLWLGHNRLSIIDLDPRSDQPFSFGDAVHIVFNGEIFNFKPLRESLTAKGYTFRTTSDTEVICAAYMEYGSQCVDHFNGMFAFVIYDARTHSLFGARDRLGQKPFYFYHNDREFEFASQLSAIQENHDGLSISSRSIQAYLLWETLPDPLSIFNEIQKLEPGHRFTFDLHKGSLKIEQYWDIDYLGTDLFTKDYAAAQEQFESLLEDAVKIRLFADVPVGIFLSGGIDSSLITALAARENPNKVKTFSVKFNTPGFDESDYAKKVANHLGTEHHIIACDYKEGLDLIGNLYRYYDEPFADASAIPSMLLSKYTREHVTVALSGDAGDESFLGYHRYRWMRYIDTAYRLPGPVRRMAAGIGLALPHYKANVIGRVLRSPDANSAYLSTKRDLDADWMENPSDDFCEAYHKYLYHDQKNCYERVSDFDLKTYLNWDINTKVDRASMAYSLEARSPLMDYRVVEFARSLPTDYKFQGGTQKRIMKDVLYKHVPASFFDRPKSGFTMPFKDWFRNELKEFVLSELDTKGLEGMPFVRPKPTQAIIQQHMDGSWNRYPIIWRLLVLKQWLNENQAGHPVR